MLIDEKEIEAYLQENLRSNKRRLESLESRDDLEDVRENSRRNILIAELALDGLKYRTMNELGITPQDIIESIPDELKYSPG